MSETIPNNYQTLQTIPNKLFQCPVVFFCPVGHDTKTLIFYPSYFLMSEDATSSRFTTPMAIVVAGALVAAALYFRSGGATPAAPSAGTPVPSPAAPAAPGETAPPVGEFKAVSSEDHIRGPENAKVTIVEYSDIECPFCKRFHPSVKQALTEYPSDVRWVYRHFPLESLHPNARIAAIGSECASEQGKFWEFLDYAFENTATGADLAKANLPNLARSAGVPNVATFTTCLDSGKYDSKVDAQAADAQVAGGQGTPYSILIGPDGQKVPFSGAQPYTSLKAEIDKLL